MDLKRELDAMGGPAANSRGEMIHLILTLCRKFETCFCKLIDGGKGGESVAFVVSLSFIDGSLHMLVGFTSAFICQLLIYQSSCRW